MKTPLKTLARTAAALALLATASALPTVAGAQDFTAMINASLAQSNQMAAQMQRMSANIVQQNMQNPAVQQAYQRHVANARAQGFTPYNFETFAYNYAATGGFSAQGVAAYQANEAANNAKVQSAWQGLQQAQQNRANAIAGLNQGFSNNQNTFGNSLMGNSTFVAPNGYSSVLPHTWQANSYHSYNGNTYYVDNGGRYYASSNGYWVPLSQR
jgi:hypothetical protein